LKIDQFFREVVDVSWVSCFFLDSQQCCATLLL